MRCVSSFLMFRLMVEFYHYRVDFYLTAQIFEVSVFRELVIIESTKWLSKPLRRA
jgi:hypothetical protein